MDLIPILITRWFLFLFKMFNLNFKLHFELCGFVHLKHVTLKCMSELYAHLFFVIQSQQMNELN